MSYFNRFQEAPPPVAPPPPPPMSGGSYTAGNGGIVNGSANGGSIYNGAILINGVYYPIANGGTVIGSADGGMGNSVSGPVTGSPAPPPMMPPAGGPPPEEEVDPLAQMARYGMPMRMPMMNGAPPQNPYGLSNGGSGGAFPPPPMPGYPSQMPGAGRAPYRP